MAAKNVQIEFPRNGYRRLMPFNRFYVERVEKLVIIHFGLVNNSGLLLDRYSTGISQLELAGLKESLMEYLGKLGSLSDPPAPWQPPAGLSPVEMFNHIGVSSNPEVAETGLNNLFVRAFNESRQIGTTGKIQVDPIVLLRSTQELQKHLIRELYSLE